MKKIFCNLSGLGKMIELKSCILLAVLAYTATAAKHVVFDKIEVVDYNKELAENVVVTLFQTADGKQAVNATSVLKLDLGNDIKVKITSKVFLLTFCSTACCTVASLGSLLKSWSILRLKTKNKKGSGQVGLF